MKDKDIKELSTALRKIAWQFGSRGLDNECCDNLSMPEFLALERIANTKDCPISTVGSYLGFTKSGATRVVNRLKKKGYVQKIRSAEDGRICCVTVTKNGKSALERANQTYCKRVEDLISGVPSKLAHQIRKVMLAMAQASKT